LAIFYFATPDNLKIWLSDTFREKIALSLTQHPLIMLF
jgi:hypothetical protein